MCGVLVGGKSTPFVWGGCIVCGVRVRCAVLGLLPPVSPLFLLGVWVWWSVGFAVVIVVGKRPVNRSDPGS